MYDKKKLDELKDSLEKWEETSLKKALSSLPERAEEFITTSSEPVERLYSPLDVADLDFGLYRLFRHYRFDIVHTFTLKQNIYGTLGARIAGVRTVLSSEREFDEKLVNRQVWDRLYLAS